LSQQIQEGKPQDPQGVLPQEIQEPDALQSNVMLLQSLPATDVKTKPQTAAVAAILTNKKWIYENIRIS
jgi:hypothetical protein